MHNDSLNGRSQTGIRRTASGTIDTDYYHQRACAERSDFLFAVLSCIARNGWRAWGCIKRRIEGESVRHRLSALSEHELKDLGLARGDIDAVASGTYSTDPTRCVRSRERLR